MSCVEILMNKKITILGVESSCDDTSAALIKNDVLLSNKVANQEIHRAYGGVVPELASRAHQQNIIPVVDQAIQEAGVKIQDIDAIAFTRGPGLMGSLLVGTSFAKGFALANEIPLIEINHLHAHVMALFIQEDEYNPKPVPKFPFLCLLVSGGNSQILIVRDFLDMEIIGRTIDDAAGEAFDKCGKIMGLPYPAGPIIDKRAKKGNPLAFEFNKPRLQGLDYSFSGLKTSFLYFIRDELKKNPSFIDERINDLCASLQRTIVEILINKLKRASKETGILEIGIAGGVSANSGLKSELHKQAQKLAWNIYIPKLAFTTDNAAMVCITGYYKYLNSEFADQSIAPIARI